MKYHLLAILITTVISASAVAQSTAFTYQGDLSVSGSPANGNYDLEFRLFDVAGGGTQLGTTLTRTNVAVAGGAFTVSLDFGGVFPGANRFLEISVRQAGGGAYTILQPRQPVTSTPYAIKSLNSETSVNATQLGGVPAADYVVTTDPRMSDPRPPTAGSANYIQNTTSQQSGANFNVSGTGTASILNATTQYNIGGIPVLSVAGTDNLIIGITAGFNNTTGIFNTFVGRRAGQSNSIGNVNSFFGRQAGMSNTTGGSNSFFGNDAGASNDSGGGHSFFGDRAGRLNTTGSLNSFFGRQAGDANSTGSFNSFFGSNAGRGNTTGSSNTLLGDNSNVGSGNLSFATAIGSQAVVSTSNTIALGRANGSDTVRIPGRSS